VTFTRWHHAEGLKSFEYFIVVSDIAALASEVAFHIGRVLSVGLSAGKDCEFWKNS